MNKPRALPSVVSFGIELLAVFKAASKEIVEIKVSSEEKAHRLRFRLNMLRKAMIVEEHWLASVAQSVEIGVREEERSVPDYTPGFIPSWLVVCKPSDDDFRSAIEAALGASVEEVLGMGEGEEREEKDEGEGTLDPEISLADFL